MRGEQVPARPYGLRHPGSLLPLIQGATFAVEDGPGNVLKSKSAITFLIVAAFSANAGPGIANWIDLWGVVSSHTLQYSGQ